MLPLRLALRFSLLAAALVASNLAHAEVPAGAPFTPEQQTALQQLVASQVRATTPAMASAAAAAVEDKTQNIETAKEVLEVGRNQLNFWLAFLGVLTTCIGLFGIVVPFFTVRNYKAEIDKLAEALRTQLALAETAVASLRDEQEKAEQHTKKIEALLQQAHDKTSLIPNAETFSGELKAEVLEKLRAEKPPQVVKLIEQAWEAHRKEDWGTAKPLWELLSLIESQDANVWFNLGYAKSKCNDPWSEVAKCFERACLITPTGLAYNNWGVALSERAKVSADFCQQDGFAQAEEKFAEAYRFDGFRISILKSWHESISSQLAFLLDDEKNLTEIKKWLIEYQLLQKQSGAPNKYEELKQKRSKIKQRMLELLLSSEQLLFSPVFIHVRDKPWMIFNLEAITGKPIEGSAQSRLIAGFRSMS